MGGQDTAGRRAGAGERTGSAASREIDARRREAGTHELHHLVWTAGSPRDSHRIAVTASVGVHLATAAEATPECVLRAADERMYVAKDASRG
jgi:GGDEF domain-containing protein